MHVQVPKHSCRSQGLEAQNGYFLCICNLIRILGIFFFNSDVHFTFTV